MSRDDHWIAPLHRAERLVTVSRLTCERTCDHECHYDPDMDPESCDGCTGMGEQERVATLRPTAADADTKRAPCVHGNPCRERDCPEYGRADADTPEPLTAEEEAIERKRIAEGYLPTPKRMARILATLDAARAVPEPSGLLPAVLWQLALAKSIQGAGITDDAEAAWTMAANLKGQLDSRGVTLAVREDERRILDAALSTERSDEGMG